MTLKEWLIFFEFAKNSNEPIVLHLLTKKGKGFPVAIEEPEKWHGSGPFDLESGKVKVAPLPLNPIIRMFLVIIFPDWLWRMIG